MEMINILIADDHPLFRDGLRSLILGEPDMVIIGEAEEGETAISLASQLLPTVILMDIQMPKLNGLEATRQVMNNQQSAQILILTMSEENEMVFAAIQAGARGYVLKEAGHNEMLRAIRAVASGEAIFSPAVANQLAHFFSKTKGQVENQFDELTPRELEVLQLIAEGQSNKRIAEQLVLSPKTVRNYVTSILSKLQLADRAQAIVTARKAGLG
mgnify:CR=1 FL=1